MSFRKKETLSKQTTTAAPSYTEIEKILKTLPLFANVEERLVAGYFTVQLKGKGAILFREGDPPDGFYVLNRGRVNVSARRQGEGEVFLGTLAPGAWFGEIAIIEKQNRTATVTCAEDCELLFADTAAFENLLKQVPALRTDSFNKTLRARTANSLKTIPFFNLLQKKKIGPMEVYDNRIALLGDLFEFRSVASNQTIFKQSDSCDGLFVIVHGRVHVSVQKVESAERMVLNELGPGDWFGEMALISETSRTATVTTAGTQCIFLFLPTGNWKNFLKIVPEAHEYLAFIIHQRTANSLKAIPLFATVEENKPWSKLGLLGSLFHYVEVQPNDFVFREGDAGDRFYVIVNGTVDVLSEPADGSKQASFKLATLRAGDYFGEIALMGGAVCRTASVQCCPNEACLLLYLTKDRFEAFIKLAPEMRPQFQLLVSQRTANTLKTIPLFKAVKENKPWSKLDILGGLFLFEQRTENEVVIAEDRPYDEEMSKFYVIVQGRLKATVQVNGAPLLLSDMTEGEYFGEICLLSLEPHQATVTVVSKTCILLSLSAGKFKKFLNVAPELVPQIQEMSRRRRERNMSMQQADVPGAASSSSSSSSTQS